MTEPSYEQYRGKTASDIDYPEFIGQLFLNHIHLESARVRRIEGGLRSGVSNVEVTESMHWTGADWESYLAGEHIDNGFDVYHKYVAVVYDDQGNKTARIEAEFSMWYQSFIPMDEETFAIFSKSTVPLNTWPYFREFLSSTIGRMGWEPYFMPIRAIGPVRTNWDHVNDVSDDSSMAM